MGKEDRVAVADLCGKSGRYGISRAVLYARLHALKIEPFRFGRKTYVTAKQIDLLDEFNTYLKQGGSTAGFQEQHGLVTAQSLEQFPADYLTSSRDLEFLERSPNWMEHFRFLEEASQNRWLLSSSQLAELLQVSVSSMLRLNQFDLYGFRFEKTGMNGSEVAWRISKQ